MACAFAATNDEPRLRRALPLAVPPVLIAIGIALLATLLIPQPAEAADMLICRKFDQEGDKRGRTIHARGKGVKYNAGDGRDVLYGTPRDDLLNGGNGDDRVYGRGGDDIVCGGTGDDKVFGDGGDDAVYGEEGDDETEGGPGDDYVLGGSEEDRVIAWGEGLDFIDGDYGADVVVGGGGDQIFGGTLNDRLSVRLTKGEDDGAQYMNGGYDDDRIVGSELDDALQGNIGEDRIFGHGGDDTLRGGGSDDLLRGDGGDDSLFGESNADGLYGSEGDDELTGGEGRDDFWGDAGFDVCNYRGGSERLNSCERVRETDRRGRVAAAREGGGGKPGGQSGSAPFVTSDGYPFPDKYARIAGFTTIRTGDGKGGMKLLDKDGSRRDKPNVVALGTVHRPRELDGRITSRPSHQRIEWAYTNTCSRDYSAPDVWRSTGNQGTTPVEFNIKMPPKRGPKCDVAIWGKIGHSKSKKSLTARLLFR
ncbi:MAG: calcium-binding protein [Acidobacteria bacterium]|nr:MAG: calcium-binding protein [Acidobacteriota bacterium]